MTRFDLVLSICFVVSGCTVCDCQKLKPDTSVPGGESEPTSAARTVETANATGVAARIAASRPLTNDDVRRLQKGLREIGFDSGPADGIVGARTKAAYVRLQSGCSRLAPRLQELNLHTAEGLEIAGTAAGKFPNRGETREIQGRLREAGFDPGPVDGVFGSRTRSALRKFNAGCLMAGEFNEVLKEKSQVVVPETAGTRGQKSSTPSLKSDGLVGLRRMAEDQQRGAVQDLRAREDVRILQLRLRDAGFDPGPFDGVMGPKTKSALAQYEASRAGKNTKVGLSARGDY
jgi:peptidoglycan hydrolase-like protein with peptidoglycan-binding domain